MWVYYAHQQLIFSAFYCCHLCSELDSIIMLCPNITIVLLENKSNRVKKMPHFIQSSSCQTLQRNVNCGSRRRNVKRLEAGTKCKTRSFIQSNDISVILNFNAYQAEPVPRSEKLWGTTCKAIQLKLPDPFEPCGQSLKANNKSLLVEETVWKLAFIPLTYPH